VFTAENAEGAEVFEGENLFLRVLCELRGK